MRERGLSIAMGLKKRLSALAELVDFRVFGSRARGNADKYSDMDVFVELERLDQSLKERFIDIAWEVGFEQAEETLADARMMLGRWCQRPVSGESLLLRHLRHVL